MYPLTAGTIAKAEKYPDHFKPLLTALKKFLETDNISAADSVMAELIETRPFNEKIAETLAAVSDQILLAEYGEAVILIDALLSAPS